MDITEEERGWALAIKEALMKENEELAKKLTDMEYVHHAIIAKDKVPKALKRIQRLDVFRQQHDIPLEVPTAEQAMESIQKFEAAAPGMFISFGKDTDHHRYLSTWNYSAFLPANYQKAEDWKNCFASFYYLFDAMQPDIQSIREGLVLVADCEDLGWKNFSLEMEKYAAHLYQDAYPVRIHEMTLLHPPALFKVMYALCKPFLSKKVKAAIRMNGTAEDVRERFPKEILPTTVGGTQSTLDMEEKLLEGLKLRYENMATFKL